MNHEKLSAIVAVFGLFSDGIAFQNVLPAPVHQSALLMGLSTENETSSSLPKTLSDSTERNFFDFVAEVKKQHPNDIYSQSDSTDSPVPNPTPVNSIVFEHTGTIVLAIVPSTHRVNITALEEATDMRPLRLASNVQQLTGFVPGGVPPIGVDATVTVVDRSLLVADSFLVGGAARPDWSLFISMDYLLTVKGVVMNQIAFSEKQSVMDGEEPVTDRRDPLERPYFSVDPPEFQAVKQYLQSGGALLSPQHVETVGRVAKVRRMAKGLSFCDFKPIRNAYGDNEDFYPWKNPRTGRPMAVQLILGKTLVEKSGLLAVKSVRAGQVLLIRGVTNVQSVDSLQKFVDTEVLDIAVSHVQQLSLTPRQSVPTSRSDRKRARELMNQDDPGLSYLHLSDIYEDPEATGTESFKVQTVDSLDAVQDFTSQVSSLLMELSVVDNENADQYKTSLVGVDCEWLPSMFLESRHEPQPVLLLQVCLHSLRSVFLLDLQKLLRPLLVEADEMNAVEAAVSDCLQSIWQSKRLVKVGFGIGNDLIRLSASYPHIHCFRRADNVLESSSLARKVMYLQNQKHTRKITSSLSQLSVAYLGKSLRKDQQCSDWSLRPLQQTQQEYAAVDAAVTPAIVDRLLNEVDARFFSKPQLGRWPDDKSLANMLSSYRFLFVDEKYDRLIRKLGAKRIVGSRHVIAQHWMTGEEQPDLPSLVDNGEGPYTDKDGFERYPTDTLTVDFESFHSIMDASVGKAIGHTKEDCILHFLDDFASDRAKLDFHRRSGVVELQNAVFLFVNMPSASSRRTYNNQWIDGGRKLSWYAYGRQWNENDCKLPRGLEAAQKHARSSVSLFVRFEKQPFIACGRCRAESADGRLWSTGEVNESEQVGLHLVLEDFDRLSQVDSFQIATGGCY